MNPIQIQTSARSRSLFHFKQKREYLQEILINKAFYPRYCIEDISWSGKSHGMPEHIEIGYPMVCFCDIPLTRIVEHINQYGSFGIGMTREWAEDQGLNPVAYINPLPRVDPFYKRNRQTSQNEVSDNLICPFATYSTEGGGEISVSAAFTKPLRGVMASEKVETLKDFYQESEWRYVPFHHRGTINRTQLAERRDNTRRLREKIAESEGKMSGDKSGFSYIRKDDFSQNCGMIDTVDDPLGFTWKDVSYIFVEKDTDIHRLVEFIRESCEIEDDFEEVQNNPTRNVNDILISRMISLETLVRDL